MAIAAMRVLQITHQILGDRERPDLLLERRSDHLANRFKHILDGEIAGCRMRMARAVLVQSDARNVVYRAVEVVGNVVIECNGIESVRDIQPAVHARRKRQTPAGPLSKRVLDLLQTQWRADGDEEWISTAGA